MILINFSVVCNHAGQPIHSGIRLVRSLHSTANVVLFTDRDLAWVERWLVLNGVDDYDNVEHRDKPLKDWVWTLATRPTLVVITDPSEAAWALENGLPSVLACFPKFALPEHRPESRSWNEIVAEMDRQLGLAVEEVEVTDFE